MTPTKPPCVAKSIFGYSGYLLAGVYFGFVLMRAEVISWYRIQEMFRFQSFHMYGVIGTAVLVGLISIWLIRRYRIKALTGEAITFTPKAPTIIRYLAGGSIFGLGWAMTGACPGPILALIGSGLSVFVMVLLAALAGTWTYSALRSKLPH